ncbi:MAG: DUF2252 family protein [Myxococcota bacterium]
MNPFLRKPYRDDREQRVAMLRGGLHLFFRKTTQRMQRRFVRLADAKSMPRVFLHGNPHLDNYVRTKTGTAMVDFDRARHGPYGYDLVRLMVSLSIRARRPMGPLLTGPVRASLRRGYLQGLLCPELGWEEMEHLRKVRANRWYETTDAYLAAGRGWAKRLHAFRVEPETVRAQKLFERYCANRSVEDWLDRYTVAQAAEVAGTMGKSHTLLLLRPRSETDDSVLLDFKETYTEKDNKWFRNPYGHQGERMRAAEALHTPGWNPLGAFVSDQGRDLWVREIETYQVKIKRQLREAELMEVATSVGSQLGRAHGQSVQAGTRFDLAERFRREYDDLIYVATTLLAEVTDAYRRYEDTATKIAA